jgi:hypothetical protein
MNIQHSDSGLVHQLTMAIGKYGSEASATGHLAPDKNLIDLLERVKAVHVAARDLFQAQYMATVRTDKMSEAEYMENYAKLVRLGEALYSADDPRVIQLRAGR